MKEGTKKLGLSKETLRTLTDDDMRSAAGGAGVVTTTCPTWPINECFHMTSGSDPKCD
ncbi:MAG TPA: class I lanthipeptide [Actinomycetota bacterium]|jgi:hypothetical protein